MPQILLSAAMAVTAAAHINQPVADLVALQTSVEIFRLHTGRYPSGEEGLKALVERPAQLPESVHWEKCLTKVPLDPWKNPYCYVEGSGFTRSGGYGYGLYSMGRDGKSATQGNDPDDINTWSDSDASPSQLTFLPRHDLAVGTAAFLLGIAATLYFRKTNRSRGAPP
ncbi:MAG: type II secretion system protein GspG [Luteolibacter sp.]